MKKCFKFTKENSSSLGIVYRPIVKVGLRDSNGEPFELSVLVDSGADISIFSRRIGPSHDYRNVQQSVFEKFLCHSSIFWKIIDYKLIQMQQAILMQQVISKNFFQYFWITCSKICDDEYRF